MNAMEKLVDLLTAGILLFGIPLMYYHGKTEQFAQMTAGQACERFLSQCSLFGEMKDAYFENLQWELNACGCKRFDIIGERQLYYPQQGGMEIFRVQKSTENFFKELEEEGRSLLMPGDRLSVVIYANDVPTVYSVIVRSGVESE